MERIIVGTDFSPQSARAAQVGAAWARRTGSTLRIVHVVPPRRWLVGLWREDLTTLSAIHRHAGAALKRLAATLDPSRELELSTGLVSGAASVEIARAARDFHADMLVIGARGEHGTRAQPPALGGTALKLLGALPLPLMLVRRAGAESPRTVFAAVDLSPVSKDVLSWARASVAGDGRIIALHAYQAPFAARLQAYGIAEESIDLYADAQRAERERELDALIAASGAGAIERLVSHGDPIDLICGHAGRLEPGLIVLGRNTRPGAAKAAGGIARHVALCAPGDLLVVRPPAR